LYFVAALTPPRTLPLTSLAIDCVVAWLVDPIWEPEVACLLRLFFGWAASEPPGMAGSGDRDLLTGAFLSSYSGN